MNPPPESPLREFSQPSSAPQICEAAREIEVVAPSRLHFGLLSFGHRGGRQYGGAGLMIERPALRLTIRAVTGDDSPTACERPSAGFPRLVAAPGRSCSHLVQRVADFAACWMRYHRMGGAEALPACQITIHTAPGQHVGLGVGTQLGLSVAAGLNAFYHLPQPKPVELAISVGRGLRSAVGTYGFVEGGLIVERGKLSGETIAPLDCRLDLPSAWRVLLIQPPAERGLSGAAEQRAFDKLPAVPSEITRQLIDEMRLRMLPAAARGEFDEFSESVYRYGRLAGMCFAAIQGGPYNGQRLERLVARVRSLGVSGVGQSSWGPTLFALLPHHASAEQFKTRLAAELADERIQLTVTPLNQTGAQVCVAAAGRRN